MLAFPMTIFFLSPEIINAVSGGALTYPVDMITAVIITAMAIRIMVKVSGICHPPCEKYIFT